MIQVTLTDYYNIVAVHLFCKFGHWWLIPRREASKSCLCWPRAIHPSSASLLVGPNLARWKVKASYSCLILCPLKESPRPSEFFTALVGRCFEMTGTPDRYKVAGSRFCEPRCAMSTNVLIFSWRLGFQRFQVRRWYGRWHGLLRKVVCTVKRKHLI